MNNVCTVGLIVMRKRKRQKGDKSLKPETRQEAGEGFSWHRDKVGDRGGFTWKFSAGNLATRQQASRPVSCFRSQTVEGGKPSLYLQYYILYCILCRENEWQWLAVNGGGGEGALLSRCQLINCQCQLRFAVSRIQNDHFFKDLYWIVFVAFYVGK